MIIRFSNFQDDIDGVIYIFKKNAAVIRNVIREKSTV